jgi:hypothetical protein
MEGVLPPSQNKCHFYFSRSQILLTLTKYIQENININSTWLVSLYRSLNLFFIINLFGYTNVTNIFDKSSQTQESLTRTNAIMTLILGESEYYDSINGRQHARATVEKYFMWCMCTHLTDLCICLHILKYTIEPNNMLCRGYNLLTFRDETIRFQMDTLIKTWDQAMSFEGRGRDSISAALSCCWLHRYGEASVSICPYACTM